MVKKAQEILHKPLNPELSNIMARGLCVGVTTGLIVSIFRWIIDQTMALLDHIYPQMLPIMFCFCPTFC